MSRVSTVLKGIRRSGEVLTAYQQTGAALKLAATCADIGNLSFPYDIPLKWGGSLRVSTRGEVKVFWEVFVHRCYRVWPSCGVVIDAGANIGAFTVWAAQRLPNARFLALEPHPDTFAKLQHNVRANSLETRVQTLQCALAAQTGQRTMSTGTESQRRTLFATDQNAAGIPVPALSVTEMLDQNHLHQVDLMKMDIEGSEWEVLHSTPKSAFSRIRRLQFEYHEVHARYGRSRDALFDHLRSVGYSLLDFHEDEHRTGVALFEQS